MLTSLSLRMMSPDQDTRFRNGLAGRRSDDACMGSHQMGSGRDGGSSSGSIHSMGKDTLRGLISARQASVMQEETLQIIHVHY